jgi:hypothetical protein
MIQAPHPGICTYCRRTWLVAPPHDTFLYCHHGKVILHPAPDGTWSLLTGVTPIEAAAIRRHGVVLYRRMARERAAVAPRADVDRGCESQANTT